MLVTLLSFGLLIPWLGFYWDDWAKILVSRLFGLPAYFAYYAEDRPLSSWTHIFFTPLLGTQPLGWHVFTLLLRWLSAWGMVWSLNGLWPQARRQNLVAGLLFLVYPVFVSQPVAVTFHQQWLQYALFFLSLGAMIQAWNKDLTLEPYKPASWKEPASRRLWGWTGLALLAMLLQLSVTEYFAPLELVRPVVLWFLFASLGVGAAASRGRFGWLPAARARKTLLAWAPYLAILALYVTWRLFFIRLPGEDPYRANTLYALLNQPLATLRQTLWTAFVDEVRILLSAWGDLLQVDLQNLTPFQLLAGAVGGLTFLLVLFFLLRWESAPASEGARLGRRLAPRKARAPRKATFVPWRTTTARGCARRWCLGWRRCCWARSRPGSPGGRWCLTSIPIAMPCRPCLARRCSPPWPSSGWRSAGCSERVLAALLVGLAVAAPFARSQ